MARTRNIEAYDDTRSRLLEVGERLLRAGSYERVGISDILREGQVPKGSFYHYFASKERFGIAVAEHYHARQIASARTILLNRAIPPQKRLVAFFQTALEDFAAREFGQGCLMCNLTTELADKEPEFQKILMNNWKELSAEIAGCIEEMDKSEIGLEHLTNAEAADWLLNSWSGALTRMKATRDKTPLTLFIKSIFKSEKK